MNRTQLLENLSAAMVAQAVSLSISVLGGLLVPKALGVEEFGYWQLFIFYVGYVGFFHLGLNDGVYLLNNGKPLYEMDKSAIVTQYAFGLTFQTVFAMAIVGFALLAYPGTDRAVVLISTAFCLLIGNTIDFFGYVFQAGNETKRYSQAIIAGQAVYFSALVVLLWSGVRSFEMYVLFYVVSKLVSLAFTIFHAREFLAARRQPLVRAFPEAKSSISIGSKLMVANIAAALTVGIVRFVIDGQWDIVVFGKVSFALSLATMLLSFVSQISMVLSPALRHSGDGYAVRFYPRAKALLDVVLPCVYLLYFPTQALVGAWLPGYAVSLLWFAVFLPMCVFNARTTIMSTTYYRVLRREKDMLAVNVGSVVVSAGIAWVGGYFFRSLSLVVAAAVVASCVRSIVSEVQLSKIMKIRLSSMMLAQSVLAVIFICSALWMDPWLAFAIVALSYAGYLVVYSAPVRDLWLQVRRVRLARLMDQE